MELNTAIDTIFTGNALLITGAGFSYGAKNSHGKEVPGVDKLKEEIIKLIDDSSIRESFEKQVSKINLASLSDYVVNKLKKEDSLINTLNELYTIKECSNEQSFLSSLPWFGMYTTNYDNILESNSSRKSLTVLDELQDVTSSKSPVYHLNGSLFKLNKQELSSTFKLTSSSYMQSELDTPVYSLFSQQVASAQAIFIIGLSLESDMDIKRLLADSEPIKEKTFFVNGPGPQDPVEAELISASIASLGNFTGKTLNEFCNDVQHQKASWDNNVTSIPPHYKAFDEITFNSTRQMKSTVHDVDVDRLIYKGSLSEDKILNSLYCVQRADYREQDYKDGKINVFSGLLGNGKTVYLLQLAYKIAQITTRKVFWFNGNDSSLTKDLLNMNRKPGNYSIFIDNFYTILPKLSILKNLNSSKFDFFFSGRTSLVTENKFRLEDIVYNRQSHMNFNISYQNINELTRESEKQFKELVKYYNLSTDYSTWHKHEISQLYSLISDLLHSKTISKRYSFTLNIEKIGDKERNIIYFILITTLIGSPIDVTLIRNIFHIQSTPADYEKSFISNFVDFFHDDILMNSSVIAHYLISNVPDEQQIIIVKLMISIMKTLDKQTPNQSISTLFDKKSNTLQRNLVSFSNFRLLMNRENYSWPTRRIKNMAANYYESISRLNFTKDNSFFWLHYAIERMDTGEWRLAKTYLDKAIKLDKDNALVQYHTQLIRWYVNVPDSELPVMLTPLSRIEKITSLISTAMPNNEALCFRQLKPLPQKIVQYYSSPEDNIEQSKLLLSINDLTARIDKLSVNIPHDNITLINSYSDLINNLKSSAAKLLI